MMAMSFQQDDRDGGPPRGTAPSGLSPGQRARGLPYHIKEHGRGTVAAPEPGSPPRHASDMQRADPAQWQLRDLAVDLTQRSGKLILGELLEAIIDHRRLYGTDLGVKDDVLDKLLNEGDPEECYGLVVSPSQLSLVLKDITVSPVSLEGTEDDQGHLSELSESMLHSFAVPVLDTLPANGALTANVPFGPESRHIAEDGQPAGNFVPSNPADTPLTRLAKAYDHVPYNHTATSRPVSPSLAVQQEHQLRQARAHVDTHSRLPTATPAILNPSRSQRAPSKLPKRTQSPGTTLSSKLPLSPNMMRRSMSRSISTSAISKSSTSAIAGIDDNVRRDRHASQPKVDDANVRPPSRSGLRLPSTDKDPIPRPRSLVLLSHAHSMHDGKRTAAEITTANDDILLEYETRMETLLLEIKGLRDELQTKKHEIRVMKEHEEVVLGEMERVDDRAQHLTKSLEQYQQQHLELRTALDSAHHREEELLARVLSLEGEVIRSKDDAAKHERDSARLTQELDRLRSERDATAEAAEAAVQSHLRGASATAAATLAGNPLGATSLASELLRAQQQQQQQQSSSKGDSGVDASGVVGSQRNLTALDVESVVRYERERSLREELERVTLALRAELSKRTGGVSTADSATQTSHSKLPQPSAHQNVAATETKISAGSDIPVPRKSSGVQVEMASCFDIATQYDSLDWRNFGVDEEGHSIFNVDTSSVMADGSGGPHFVDARRGDEGGSPCPTPSADAVDKNCVVEGSRHDGVLPLTPKAPGWEGIADTGSGIEALPLPPLRPPNVFSLRWTKLSAGPFRPVHMAVIFMTFLLTAVSVWSVSTGGAGGLFERRSGPAGIDCGAYTRSNIGGLDTATTIAMQNWLAPSPWRQPYCLFGLSDSDPEVIPF